MVGTSTTALNWVVKSTDEVVVTMMFESVTMLPGEDEAAPEFGMVGRIVGKALGAEFSVIRRVVLAVDETQVVTNVVNVAEAEELAGSIILRVVVPLLRVKRVMVLPCARQRVIVDEP